MIEFYPSRLQGLGASCPEGSSTKYTGPEGPNGCRCSPGRVWELGYCQSPQSLAQQAGQSAKELTAQHGTGTAWATQPLSSSARAYLERMGYSVNCKILKGAQTPVGAAEWMGCSINGGPYQHGAYALNLNPGAAITELRTMQAQEVAAATPGAAYGAAPGSAVFSTPEGNKAVTAAREALQAQYGNELMPPDGGAYIPPNPVNVIGGPGGAPIAPGTQPPAPIPPQNLPLPGGYDPASGGVDYFAWLPPVATEEWIGGIPNWLLIAAGLGAGYMAFKSN